MTDIVKICKIHGDLTSDMAYQTFSRYKEKRYPYLQCKICISDKRKRIYYANHDKYKKYALEQRKKHYNKCIERDRKYKRQLLINESQYNKLNAKQEGLCGICNNPETSKSHKNRIKVKENEITNIKRLAIDHCHKTKKIRGLLCSRCNTALGLFKDSIELLKSAIKYLKPTY